MICDKYLKKMSKWAYNFVKMSQKGDFEDPKVPNYNVSTKSVLD
jgi:hypothetical protein